MTQAIQTRTTASNIEIAGGKPLADLLTRCKAGDSEAWDTLINQYERSVYKFAYSLSHSHDDADDIVAQVFLRIYLNLNSYRYEAAFSAWLFRIVKNTYIDLCLRPRSSSDISLDIPIIVIAGTPGSREILDPKTGPEKMCIDNETSTVLALAIRHLPAIQRNVMKMYHAEGKSYAEIAENTGVSIGTVKSRLNRARTMLRERLDPFRDLLMTT